MSNLKKLIADAIKEIQPDINAAAEKALDAGVNAKAPSVSAPKEIVTSGMALKGASIEAQRIGELGFVAKTMRNVLNHDGLSSADLKDLSGRFKAVGVTTDIAELLPSGFTGALWYDIQERLVVTALFPYKETAPGQYDSIAIHGITGYLTAENISGTESAEDYITMIYLVVKCMAVVKKSYEALDDALIALAQEVRNGIIDALARAIEDAVVNGDNTVPHMDDAATSGTFIGAAAYSRGYKGLRKLGLGKNPIDFGGAALSESDWLTKISAMQAQGGVYTDNLETSRGNVVLLVDQNAYNQLRMLPSFLTKEKAAGMATLFGAPIDTVFDVPVMMTPFLPIVDASGVRDDTTPANNITSTCIMVNKDTMKYYTTGTPLMESDRDIQTQFVRFTGSVRTGFNSIFDRLDSAPNDIDATRDNIVVGINIARI